MYGNLWPKGAFKNQGNKDSYLSTAAMVNGHRTVNGAVNSGNNRELLQLTGLKRGKKYERTSTWKI